MQHPFEIEFIDPREIRMGSPYFYCSIRVVGETKCQIEGNFWQDKSAWSEDNRYLALIKWNLANNNPGFHFVVFDTITGKTFQSDRIIGMVNSIFMSGGVILYNKFRYVGINADGTLNENTDHELEFGHMLGQ